MYVSYCYLLLGSNLGDKKTQLEKANTLINNTIGKIKKKSEIVETDPIGFESANSFLNQIVFVETQMSPMQVLSHTQEIEKKIGRNEKSENGVYKDRIIDIDILLFNDLTFKSKALVIPHYNNMENRKFVKEIFDNLSL